MTRELKFRAWDGKGWLENFFIKDGIACTWEQPYGASIASPCVIRKHPNAIIEQYTGLKDKNGVEIYEGDIVRGKSGSGVVDYSERGTRFGIHTTKPHYICGTPISKYYSLIGCKVIGNIHENPELLK